jgi:thiamine kinase-like enzyme
LNPKPNNDNANQKNANQKSANQKRELSEEQQKREKDRKEWARKLDEKHRERMRALKEQSRMAAAQQLIDKPKATIATIDHQAMVEDMLKELYQRNPEWEARMKKAQRVSDIILDPCYLRFILPW